MIADMPDLVFSVAKEQLLSVIPLTLKAQTPWRQHVLKVANIRPEPCCERATFLLHSSHINS